MKRMIVARGGKRGKTAGRGGKGQSARAGNKRRPEWRDIIKKLPKLRGRGKNSNKTIMTTREKPVVVNLAVIAGAFKTGDAITPAILVEKGVISTWSGHVPQVKILGDGELKIILKVSGCEASATAKAEIEKAGGSVAPTRPEADARAEAKLALTAKMAAEAKAKKPEAKQPEAKAKQVTEKKEKKSAAPATEKKASAKKPVAPKK